MKETEQTLLDQIKDQVAREIVKKEFTNIHDVLVEEFYRDWSDLLASENVEEYLDEVCERYYQAKAKASCEETLKKASENATLMSYDHYIGIDKSSITDPSNIVIV